jgi:glycosyltransferase involved in cell wall biosynthesis
MNNYPLVSVVIPVYNAQKYLHETIESVLVQTHTNFELILVNDGSTDNSEKIIRQFQKKDNRIILKNSKNLGIASALNNAIQISKGKYIARLDADDISLPHRIKKQVKFMEANPSIDVCGSWVEIFGEYDNNFIWKFPINDKQLKTRLLFSVPFAHPSVMMRQKLIKKFDLKYNLEYPTVVDYKFWLDVSKHAKFATIPEVLIKYRYIKTSISRVADRDFTKRYVMTKKVFSELLENLNIKNTEDENLLHFTIGYNVRIDKAKINLKNLSKYLNKLIEANKIKNIFNQKCLENFLGKKFLIVIFYKIKNKDISFINAIFYKFFWDALLDYIKKKLKYAKN